MKSKIYKLLSIFFVVMSLTALASPADAYWRNGYHHHRHYHCRWVRGHYHHGHWIPAHKVCWWRRW